jgi:hypothetical protein
MITLKNVRCALSHSYSLLLIQQVNSRSCDIILDLQLSRILWPICIFLTSTHVSADGHPEHGSSAKVNCSALDLSSRSLNFLTYFFITDMHCNLFVYITGCYIL